MEKKQNATTESKKRTSSSMALITSGGSASAKRPRPCSCAGGDASMKVSTADEPANNDSLMLLQQAQHSQQQQQHKNTPSRRFVWSKELNQDFSSSVFRLGLQKAKPEQVYQELRQLFPDLTVQQMSIYLHEYSQTASEVSKQQEQHPDQACSGIAASLELSNQVPTPSPSATIQEKNQPPVQSHQREVASSALSVAQHLIQNFPRNNTLHSNADNPTCACNKDAAPNSDRVFVVPKYTDQTKRSPHGIAMGHLLGLFCALQQELFDARSAAPKHDSIAANHPIDASVAAVRPDVPIMPATAEVKTVPQSENSSRNDDASDDASSHHEYHDWQSTIQQLVNFSKQQNQAYHGGMASKGRRNLEVSGQLCHAMGSQRAFRHQLHALKQHEVEKCGF